MSNWGKENRYYTMFSTEMNDDIKVDPALESCLGEIMLAITCVKQEVRAIGTIPLVVLLLKVRGRCDFIDAFQGQLCGPSLDV